MKFRFVGDSDFKDELRELQGEFASRQFRDEIRRMQRRSNGVRRTPARKMVKTLRAIRLRIDGSKNHNRPHVHVDYGKNRHAASFAIDNGDSLGREAEQKV
jgi:hypothetical protein